MAENPRPPATGYPVPPSGAYTNGYPPAVSNTAYTYAAPQYSNYQYHGQLQQQYPRRSAFMRYFLVVVIAFFIITGCIFFIVWLVFRPRIPEFSVQSVKVSNFSVVDTMHVSGTWQVGLLLVNPNKKMKISYGTINAELYYNSEFITLTLIPPLDQDTRNQTALDALFSADNAYVQPRAVSDLNSDRAKGNVAFQIKGEARIRFSSGWWRVRRRELRFWCVDLAVGLSSSSNGTVNLTDGKRNCKVSI
ncbi:hypothetical protein SAY86_001598 [Trapa natans]|uniref:Late embryogenesis abundant protein LEA-2 subgroup domain-containing protein n=1 Tax=Trapa natans TaxID=22666 RepID=A0AAN7QYT2_TRANT|nr:hypothetical protein SAY86_001598 [Trapa natans]